MDMMITTSYGSYLNNTQTMPTPERGLSRDIAGEDSSRAVCGAVLCAGASYPRPGHCSLDSFRFCPSPIAVSLVMRFVTPPALKSEEVGFAEPLASFIQAQYNEDPSDFAASVSEVTSLRQNAVSHGAAKHESGLKAIER